MTMALAFHRIAEFKTGPVRQHHTDGQAFFHRTLVIQDEEGERTEIGLFADTNESLIPEQEHAVNVGTAAERAAERQMIAEALADLKRWMIAEGADGMRGELRGVDMAARAIHHLLGQRPGRFNAGEFLSTVESVIPAPAAPDSRTEWEGDVINAVAEALEITRSDATGVVDAQSFRMAQAWARGDDAKAAASAVIAESEEV